MGPGNMIHSIFGFCDVRQFTDTTECLQEEVMLFVNRIAHIIHSIVVQCNGAANKNIGDAFLLTWKLDDKYSKDQVTSLADQALLAFCKSLIELSRHQTFICNFSVGATSRLYQRFPGYNVRIGCGLHVGWAIEGAIGSNMKIDASYLSPHVSFTEFLESSTKAYGVSLLMSEPFFKLLSPNVSRLCRQVDRIRRSDEEEPIGLYTYDTDLTVDWDDLALRRRFTRNPRGSTAGPNLLKRPSRRTSTMRRDLSRGGGYELRQLKQSSLGRSTRNLQGFNALNQNNPTNPLNSLNDIENPITNPIELSTEAPIIKIIKYNSDVWNTDLDLVELRHNVNEIFRELWAKGFRIYIAGNWNDAREIFIETLNLSNGRDGPSLHILKNISDHNDTAPTDWAGYTLEDDSH